MFKRRQRLSDNVPTTRRQLRKLYKDMPDYLFNMLWDMYVSALEGHLAAHCVSPELSENLYGAFLDFLAKAVELSTEEAEKGDTKAKPEQLAFEFRD